MSKPPTWWSCAVGYCVPEDDKPITITSKETTMRKVNVSKKIKQINTLQKKIAVLLESVQNAIASSSEEKSTAKSKANRKNKEEGVSRRKKSKAEETKKVGRKKSSEEKPAKRLKAGKKGVKSEKPGKKNKKISRKHVELNGD